MTTHELNAASRALTLLACGTIAVLVSVSPGAGDPTPEYVELTGVVRDFLERTAPGGHPDFEVTPDHGYKLYEGNVAPYLGANRKPVFTGDGARVDQQWRDSQNRPICYLVYDPARGDHPGTWGPADTGGIESAESFNQWYRDVPGVNMSKLLTLKLVRQDDGSYVFDDDRDPLYDALGGFFPIEGQLLGNPGGSPDRNFHFTYELHTLFTYDEGAGHIFRFTGDDDVWVFIDGRLVIDLGGVHSAKDQVVELDRLGLEDGETYTLDFFFAERHRTQSNFRITTNLNLKSTGVPTVSAIFD